METLLLVRKHTNKAEMRSREQQRSLTFPHVKIRQEPISAFHCGDQSGFSIEERIKDEAEKHKNLPDSCLTPGHSCRRDHCSRTSHKCPGIGQSLSGCSLHRSPATAWKNTSGERQVMTKRPVSLFHCSREADCNYHQRL